MSWEVQLTGDSADLQMLADSLTSGEIRVARSGNRYVLRSTHFEVLDSATSVRRRAIELVTALSGSARLVLQAREEISVGGTVYRVLPDGKRAPTVLIGQGVSSEGALPITVVHGAQFHRPAGPILKWFPLVTQEPAITKVLRLRNADNLEWVDLYRIYEVIENDVGYLMHQGGWASQNELTRFARTANSVAASGDKARHGVERTAPPRNPMSLAYARELIDRIIRAWLEWKARHHDPRTDS